MNTVFKSAHILRVSYAGEVIVHKSPRRAKLDYDPVCRPLFAIPTFCLGIPASKIQSNKGVGCYIEQTSWYPIMLSVNKNLHAAFPCALMWHLTLVLPYIEMFV